MSENMMAWTPLDEEVAERVMGWQLVSLSAPQWKDWWPAWPRTTRMYLEILPEDPAPSISDPYPRPIPRFSTNLMEALRVLDRMRKLGHDWLLNANKTGFHLRRVFPGKHAPLIPGEVHSCDRPCYICDMPLGDAETLEELPKIICKAALEEIKSV